uniref:Uncharacterized protein n=1 Tax=Arundo donax TaxID=35708 RepID=A0A0A9EWH4_ARUDO
MYTALLIKICISITSLKEVTHSPNPPCGKRTVLLLKTTRENARTRMEGTNML